MKRVCMVVMSLYPQDERVRRQAEALERTGVPVDIICMRGREQSLTETLGLITAHRIMQEGKKDTLSQYLLLSLRFLILSLAKVQSLSKHMDFNALQVHNMPDFLVFAGFFHKLSGKPLVLDLHDLTVELFGSKWGQRKSTLLLPFVRAAERISCRFADKLITTSHGFQDSLVERGNLLEKITLVINTPDPNIFHFHSEREFAPITREAKLLYHGTVDERFGVAKAIDAVGMLQNKIPGSVLNVFGQYSPSYRKVLENKIIDLGLSERVFLHGWKSLEKVYQIICDSDIGVVPYLQDSFMDLALSTKTFEYTTTGLPVVASRLRSITSIFNDDCIRFVDPSSASDLAENIADLCLDPDARKKQTEAALKVLPSISGNVMLGRYLDLMHGLMDRTLTIHETRGNQEYKVRLRQNLEDK